MLIYINGYIHALTNFKSAAMYFGIVELDPIQEFVEECTCLPALLTRNTTQSTQLPQFLKLIPLVSRSAPMSSEGLYIVGSYLFLNKMKLDVDMF